MSNYQWQTENRQTQNQKSKQATNDHFYTMKTAQKIGLYLLLLLSVATNSKAYSPKIDSLLAEANEIEDNRKRTVDVLKVVNTLSAISVLKALAADDSLISLYSKRSDSFSLARAKSLKSWHLCFRAEYEEAFTLAYEALQIQEELKDTAGLARTKMRIGIINIYLEKHDKAIAQLKASLLLFENLKDTQGIDLIYNNLGVAYSEQEKYEESIISYKKSLNIRKKIPNYNYWVGYSYYNIANSFMDLKQLDSADYYMEKAKSVFLYETENARIPSLASLGMAELRFKQDKFSQAEDYVMQAMEIARQQKQIDFLGECYKLLTRIYEKRKEFEKALDALKEHNRIKSEIDSSNNQKDIAEIEALYNQALNKQKIAELEKSQAESALKNKRNRWLIAIISLAALLIVLSVLFYFNRKYQRQKLSAQALETEVAETKLMALRAQMNPHFIFNCINTAQNFVVNANKLDAYEFLADFARLLRLVLENSGKQVVTLNEELEQLKLYVSLEQIRFEQKFEVVYELDAVQDLKNNEVPSMLLQPLVENAILHGLMNKTDYEKGRLVMSASADDEGVTFTIDDNGVGRKNAMQIKSKKSLHYQSQAMSNVQERLAIISKNLHTQIGFQIIDKETLNEQGTRVMIKLPFL